MKRNKRLLTVAAVLLIVVAAAVFFLKPKGKAPEYIFTYAENQMSDYPTTLAGQYFAKLVEENTDGRIKILVKYDGERGTESEVVEQLKYGGVDFAKLSLAELTDDMDELNVLMLPYLYESSEHMWKVLDGEIGEHFLNALSETDLVGLSWFDAGARNFYTVKHPIRGLEDLVGMKIRVQESNFMVDVVSAFGAVPVKSAYSEVYSMLECLEVDGAENNWTSYEMTQHDKVAKYITITEHMRIPEVQICSKHTWEKLSNEDQQIILECAKRAALYEREAWALQEKNSKKAAEKEKVSIYYLSAEEKQKFQEAVKPLYEQYYENYADFIEKIIACGN